MADAARPALPSRGALPKLAARAEEATRRLTRRRKPIAVRPKNAT
jgi:hypothetical protein